MAVKTIDVISPPTTREETSELQPEANAYPLPPLPTFDWEVGYREVYDPETGTFDQVQLTLLELMYPTEEDVGVVKVSQSPIHDLWTNWLKVMLQVFLQARQWFVTNDVLIHWGRKGAPPKSPDLAAMPGGHLPARTEKSYLVGRDGPLPAFILEITSEDSRPADMDEKPLVYAAVGVKEMLVVDFWPEEGDDWQLLGYRLEDSPYYMEIEPDEEGGLTFETVGLRFVARGHERIDVYDIATGERLLTPAELRVHAEAEAARAEAEAARAETQAARAQAEAAAREAAEARIAELEARVRELESRS
jgi:Uma2 family endonuclease